MALPSNPSTPEQHYFRFRFGGWNGTVGVCCQNGQTEARTIFDQVEKPSVGWQRHFGKPGIEGRDFAASAVADAINRTFAHCAHAGDVILECQRQKLQPGEHYPRIWRPHTAWKSPDYRPLRTDGKVALGHLDDIALEIFRVVEPTRNLDAFGHRIRELLLLASMEAENSMAAVLEANSALPDRANTNHYVKLRDPMNLHWCRLHLPEYPAIGLLTPFEGWEAEKATATLPWYAAYNRTKHSRSNGFESATLRNALSALAAAWILHAMQFGPDAFTADANMWALFGYCDFFEAGEGYLFNLWEEKPKPVVFPFDP